jgi:hypothetical protein
VSVAIPVCLRCVDTDGGCDAHPPNIDASAIATVKLVKDWAILFFIGSLCSVTIGGTCLKIARKLHATSGFYHMQSVTIIRLPVIFGSSFAALKASLSPPPTSPPS